MLKRYMSQQPTDDTPARASVALPWSEVCMYMHVAGATRDVEVTPRGVTILDRDGRPMGGPVTLGEAGIYRDGDGYFYYAA